MLIAYDRSGNILATLDFLVTEGEEGAALVDFEGIEASGGKLRTCWEVSGAAGSCTWPEYLGEGVHRYRVVLDRSEAHPARRLVHRVSGAVRERADIEREMERRIGRAPRDGEGRRVVDLRDLLGSPGRPLDLDEQGRVVERPPTGRPRLLARPTGSQRKG